MDETACPVNIGPNERRKRFFAGLLFFALGLALFGALLVSEANRFWRMALLFPFWAGILGLEQSLEKICVDLAFQGKENLDSGERDLSGETGLLIKMKAREILVTSILIAVCVTLFCFVVPK